MTTVGPAPGLQPLDVEIFERVRTLTKKQRHHREEAAQSRREAERAEQLAAECDALAAAYLQLAEDGGLTNVEKWLEAAP